MIRTFIAVPVPDRVKRVKQFLFSTLENEKVKIKWVRNMQIHLTLKFLGFTPDRSVNRLKSIIANVIAKYEPFDLTIRNTGCFPLPSRPRVLWLDVNDETDQLVLLVNDLENDFMPIFSGTDEAIKLGQKFEDYLNSLRRIGKAPQIPLDFRDLDFQLVARGCAFNRVRLLTLSPLCPNV